MEEMKHNSIVYKKKLVLFALFLNVLIMVMNTSMFNIAVPVITEDFQINTAAASWIVTSYSVFFAIGVVVYGRLGTNAAIPFLLTIGLLLLGAGSILGVFAETYPLLILARVIQAAGTSSVSALGMQMITRYFPVEEKAKAMSIYASASTLGFGLGPLVGGLLTEYLGWSFLFMVSVLGALMIPVYRKNVPSEVPGGSLFDIPGFLLLSTAAVSALLFVSTGSLFFLAGVVAFALFLIHINRVKKPFIAPSLLKQPIYVLSLAIGFAVFFIHFAILFITPLLLADVYSLNTAAIGWIIFPGAAGSAVLMIVIGRMAEKTGIFFIIGSGTVCVTAASILYAGFGGHEPWLMGLFFLVSSLGFSCITMGVPNYLSGKLDSAEFSSGFGLLQLTQFIGGAFGVAVSGKLLSWDRLAGNPLFFVWQGAGAAYSNSYAFLIGIAILSMVCFGFFYKQAGRFRSETF